MGGSFVEKDGGEGIIKSVLQYKCKKCNKSVSFFFFFCVGF